MVLTMKWCVVLKACVARVYLGVSASSRHFSLFGGAKIGASVTLFFCARLNFDQFLRIQKAKNHDFKPAESPSETLATQVILNFLDVKKIRYFDSNCVECNEQHKTKLNFDQFAL